MSDDIKKIVKSMKEDKNGDVEFVLTIDNDEKHFWPSHLSGVYLADRIEDIRSFSEDHEAKLNTVISVLELMNILIRFLFISQESRLLILKVV